MRLQDKVAIVTGRGRGIGRAIALGLTREGARIVVASRTPGQVRQVAEEIHRQGGEGSAVECDVSQESQVRAMISAALGRYGRIDILVNSAGGGNLRPVWGTPQDEARFVTGQAIALDWFGPASRPA